MVSSYRKAGKVKYPLGASDCMTTLKHTSLTLAAVVDAAYADSKDAEADKAKLAFNCAQRAHQNTLENAQYVLAGLLITGLKHPKVAVAFGVSGLIGRVLYTLGYATGDPKKRNRGAAHYLATHGMCSWNPTFLFSVLISHSSQVYFSALPTPSSSLFSKARASCRRISSKIPQ